MFMKLKRPPLSTDISNPDYDILIYLYVIQFENPCRTVRFCKQHSRYYVAGIMVFKYCIDDFMNLMMQKIWLTSKITFKTKKIIYICFINCNEFTNRNSIMDRPGRCFETWVF